MKPTKKKTMKLILSRKGFDSSFGGCPSPIFSDGTMLSLPIPGKTGATTYNDIAGNAHATVAELVQDLAGLSPTQLAHLDPDLSAHSLPRCEGWRPLFGQDSKAERHLENQCVGAGDEDQGVGAVDVNQCVGAGDVFLFFGLFREVENPAGKWRYVRGSHPKHVIFGWLQICRRVAVSDWPESEGWALYHPHFQQKPDPTNVLYVAKERLALPGWNTPSIAGAGLFPGFTPRLQLTEPACSQTSLWLLPEWFHPDGRASVLSYHGSAAWGERSKAGVKLPSAYPGQEFVLDCDHYKEAINWLHELLAPTKQ